MTERISAATPIEQDTRAGGAPSDERGFEAAATALQFAEQTLQAIAEGPDAVQNPGDEDGRVYSFVGARKRARLAYDRIRRTNAVDALLSACAGGALPDKELLKEAHAQIRHIIDDLTDAVDDGGLVRYVPRQNLTFSNCIAALIPLANRMLPEGAGGALSAAAGQQIQQGLVHPASGDAGQGSQGEGSTLPAAAPSAGGSAK